MTQKKKSIMIGVKLDPKKARALSAAAFNKGMGAATLVRALIEKFLAEGDGRI